VVKPTPVVSTLNPKLIGELQAIVGEKSVLFQPADLHLYSYDAALDRATPSAVVLPSTPEQVTQVIRLLAIHKRPFVARGAATSLCGGPVPLKNAVVIGMSRLQNIGRFDKTRREIAVEAGVVNLKLQQALEPMGMFFPPDPGSQKACTIGGNAATNAGGPHCLKYGVTSHYVVGMEIVLPDGTPVHVRVEDPGYDIVGFFVGSEGTLGVATRFRLKVIPKPVVVRTALVSFNTIEDCIQSVTDIIAAGLNPATLEAMDRTVVEAVEAFIQAGYPQAEAVLLVEVDGDKVEELDNQMKSIEEICVRNGSQEFRYAKSEAERVKLWDGRRGAYAAMARLAPNVLVEDGAVPRTKLPQALAEIKKIAEELDLRVALLFHAGDGNLHPQIIFDERNAEHTKVVKEAGYRMLKACVDLGGTISGEHGIGIDKREAMRWVFTRETLMLFRRLKNIFDPENLCNPDKLIPLVSKAPPLPPPDDIEFKVGQDGSVVPADEAEMIRIVSQFARKKTLFGIGGSESRFRVKENLVIRTSLLNKVLDFDPANLTITVQSGAPLEAVRKSVEAEGRYLWVFGGGTVGGAVATRASVAPPLRDLILGMRILLPTGEIAVMGAKTMKNVAGYDVPKLLLGSFGTLAVILDVTFRLYPYASKESAVAKVRPFILKDMHRRIKKAFDPESILSPRTCGLTETDLPNIETEIADPFRGGGVGNHGDRFWL